MENQAWLLGHQLLWQVCWLFKGNVGGAGGGYCFCIKGKTVGRAQTSQMSAHLHSDRLFLSNIGSIDKLVCYCSVFPLKFC